MLGVVADREKKKNVPDGPDLPAPIIGKSLILVEFHPVVHVVDLDHEQEQIPQDFSHVLIEKVNDVLHQGKNLQLFNFLVFHNLSSYP